MSVSLFSAGRPSDLSYNNPSYSALLIEAVCTAAHGQGQPQRTGLSAESMSIMAPDPYGRRIAFDTGSDDRKPSSELWVLENIPAAAESKTAASAK